MADQDSTLQILIDVRARLAAIDDSLRGLGQVEKAAAKSGDALLEQGKAAAETGGKLLDAAQQQTALAEASREATKGAEAQRDALHQTTQQIAETAEKIAQTAHEQVVLQGATKEAAQATAAQGAAIQQTTAQIATTSERTAVLTDKLLESQEAFRVVKDASTSFTGMLRTGLGIDLARRGLDLLVGTLKEAATHSFEVAAQLKDTATNIGISVESFQVLRDMTVNAGGSVEALTGALNDQQRSLVQARNVNSGAAAAYRQLNLDAARLANLPVERQFEQIAFAISHATDKQAAYAAASQILGTRNLPQLRQALRDLAVEGYDKVKESAEGAGRFMSAETIARLAAAKQGLANGKDILTAKIGEDFASALKFFGQEVTVPQPETKSAKEIDAAKKQAEQREALAEATAKLASNERSLAVAQADGTAGTAEKDFTILAHLAQQKTLLEQIVALREAMPLAIEDAETEPKRADEIDALRARIRALQNEIQARNGVGPTAFDQRKEKFRAFNEPTPFTTATNRDPRLNASEGVAAGAMDWVSSLGSQGDQVAAAMQSSIGATVQSISEGIYGWITGTESFGDAMMNLGSTILQTMLQTIIQMGVQWLINAVLIKTGMISIEATGDALRTARVVKENAAEVATLPAKTAGAAASGISSYGVALAFGALAIAVVLGAMSMFDTGGYTGDGGVKEIAGIAHRGEVIFSQDDVARHGGPAAVEAMRLGDGAGAIEAMPVAMPAPLSAPATGSPIAAGAALAAAAAAAATRQKPSRTVVVDSRRLAEQLRDDPAFFTTVQDMITGNPGAFGIAS
ncbi:hypothetical protein K0B96_06675 [Horticoccus luteus]|uniref:Tape measure domain-containing protein n=1 Tax=Horticoccus luteus TaxID=2862869 RepID=A0A8F9TW24_9BACT|nr:hypothetical protein [Horticoccus luteus]QYM80294.1 hypothetical protein K0B96_06675 [Horticoccus luteus]